MSQEFNLIEQAIEKISKRDSFSRDRDIKRIVEAILFSSSEAIPLEKIKEIVAISYPVKSRDLKKLIYQLEEEYRLQERAFGIYEIGGGFLLRTDPEMRPYLEKMFQNRRSEKLSQAATEVLAVIAYRSPITRREIEKLRGVDCSGIVASLLERGLIEAMGRKEAPGRPVQYGITQQFLQYFGLKNIQDFVAQL